MKKLSFFLLIFSINFCIAQNPIPNPGFETYWGLTGQPNGWTDSRDINQVAPAYAGQHSGQGYKSASTYPAFITSTAGAGIPISIPYTYFNMYYKFTSVSGDAMYVSVSVRDASHAQIGSGSMQVTNSVTTFTPMSVPIYYSGSNPADVIISVLISGSGGTPHVGSNFIMDELDLTMFPLAVENIEKESPVIRIFPNPAKGYIEIRNGSKTDKTATVQITDILGQKVKELSEVDFSAAIPRINISDLHPGNYIVTIRQDEMIQTKRLVIE
jgi:hypothetical protein